MLNGRETPFFVNVKTQEMFVLYLGQEKPGKVREFVPPEFALTLSLPVSKNEQNVYRMI